MPGQGYQRRRASHSVQKSKEGFLEEESESLSPVQLFATPWTIQSLEFSRPEYLSGQPFPSPGDLPNPGIKPGSPALQADSLPAELPGKPSWSRRQGLHQGAEGEKAVKRIRCNQG